jgi:hypothetical protein
MGQFSVKTYNPPGSLLSATQQKENLRLRRAISDLTLDKLILQEAAKGNF